MKKDIAIKWVEALRSGKYVQGHGQLHNAQDNTYCCLGVLCDITGTSLDENINLSPAQKNATSLSTSNGIYNSLNECLSEKNDNGMSFTDIADIIEKEWEKL